MNGDFITYDSQVGQVSACFAKAFQRVPKSMISSVTSADLGPPLPPDKEHVEVYVFEVSMEIKEEDGRVITRLMYLVESKCSRTFIILDYLMMVGVKYIVFEVFFCHCDIFSRGCTIERSIPAGFLL